VNEHDYYASELFIHDELKRRAEAGLINVMDEWRVKGRIDPFMLSWPFGKLLDDQGLPVDDLVAMPLSADKSQWSTEMKRLVKRTQPYALLLCEQREREVVVIFESQHGTSSWHFPILKTGNSFLGNRTEKKDTESIGILWRPETAQTS